MTKAQLLAIGSTAGLCPALDTENDMEHFNRLTPAEAEHLPHLDTLAHRAHAVRPVQSARKEAQQGSYNRDRSMTKITDQFRARLTANAEDFDGIVASMLAVMEGQEQRIESMRGALRRCAEVMRRSDLEEFEPEISPVTSVEWFSAIEMAERMATDNAMLRGDVPRHKT